MAAVQTNEDGQSVAMRFIELMEFRTMEIAQWAKRRLTASSLVVSDGLKCYSG
ncbi:MAG: hypothetical protein HPY30_14420 [Gammaproteobacteria bacterium (ex Lamellibrachia satsuma)]|nr:MAG: hypothetical protein HPY30_14420 [Gammaproteobacteria bacterium (ex Lamellibrachia satsuma)]